MRKDTEQNEMKAIISSIYSSKVESEVMKLLRLPRKSLAEELKEEKVFNPNDPHTWSQKTLERLEVVLENPAMREAFKEEFFKGEEPIPMSEIVIRRQNLALAIKASAYDDNIYSQAMKVLKNNKNNEDVDNKVIPFDSMSPLTWPNYILNAVKLKFGTNTPLSRRRMLENSYISINQEMNRVFSEIDERNS